MPGLPRDHTSTSTTVDVADKIEVQCECGKLFRVRDKYAGKRGKCPHCGVIVAIPWPELTEDDLLSDVDELPDTLQPLADDDDLPTRSSEPTHPTTCPSCNASLPPDAVLCLACGYHMQTGQRFKSVVEAKKEHVPDLPKGI
ncbi:MAG: hypothetical protein ABGZ53_09955, partial [Fuerstiella sp.]